MLQRVANQTLTASPQPAVTVEGPVFKMSPPTNDVTNGVVVAASGDIVAPARLPTSPAATQQQLNNPTAQQQGLNTATPTTTVVPTHKRTPKDFIFGKVIGEGSFSTVSGRFFF